MIFFFSKPEEMKCGIKLRFLLGLRCCHADHGLSRSSFRSFQPVAGGTAMGSTQSSWRCVRCLAHPPGSKCQCASIWFYRDERTTQLRTYTEKEHRMLSGSLPGAVRRLCGGCVRSLQDLSGSCVLADHHLWSCIKGLRVRMATAPRCKREQRRSISSVVKITIGSFVVMPRSTMFHRRNFLPQKSYSYKRLQSLNIGLCRLEV